MTRVNAGVPAYRLTRQHLIAEHREIVRIPNAVRSGRANLTGIPTEFRLGAGHVKFFYDKLKYVHDRYVELYDECVKRGYRMTWFGDSFVGLPSDLYNDYSPTPEGTSIVERRIAERLPKNATANGKSKDNDNRVGNKIGDGESSSRSREANRLPDVLLR